MALNSQPARFDVLGTPLDAISPQAAITRIIATCADPTTKPAYVIKPYVEFLDRTSHDPMITSLLSGAWLSLADGIAAVWAAHYLYAGAHSTRRYLQTIIQIVTKPSALERPLPGRVAGINFTWPLLEQAAAKRIRVYLIGGKDATSIARTTASLKRSIPGIQIVGTLPGRDPRRSLGHVSPEWIRETAERLVELKPDLILVGMGFPLQEAVMDQLAPLITHGIMIGEGGTFDYAAFGGARRKAPRILQRFGLEWLWRLLLEPRRLKRQLAIPRVMYRIWRVRRPVISRRL